MNQESEIPSVSKPLRAIAVDARSLARRSRTELEAIFATLASPEPAELYGDLRGSVVNIRGVDYLPSWLSRGIYALLRTPLNIWRVKRFGTDRGINRWGFGKGQWSFAAYRLNHSVALDKMPCTRLDYDLAENPLPLRGILGEVRRLGPGLLLARMNYRIGTTHTCLLYFTLEH